MLWGGVGAGKIGIRSLVLLFLKVNADILPLLLGPSGFPAGLTGMAVSSALELSVGS